MKIKVLISRSQQTLYTLQLIDLRHAKKFQENQALPESVHVKENILMSFSKSCPIDQTDNNMFYNKKSDIISFYSIEVVIRITTFFGQIRLF